MRSSLPLEQVITEKQNQQLILISCTRFLHALVHEKKHVFQQIVRNVFWFCPDVLSSGTLTFIIVCNRKAVSGNLGYNECHVNQRHQPYDCLSLMCCHYLVLSLVD